MPSAGHTAWPGWWGSPEQLSKDSPYRSAAQAEHVEAENAAAPPAPVPGALRARAVLASTEVRPAQSPPTPAIKEFLRLRKKLWGIVKIEERLEAGLQIDVQQHRKLQSKEEVVSQLTNAVRLVTEEETAAVEENEGQQQTASWTHGIEPMPVSPMGANAQVTAPHLGTVQVFVVPVIFSGTLEQLQVQQNQQPQQQASYPWPVYSLHPLAVPLGQFQPCAPLLAHVCTKGCVELDVRPDTANKSTRMRRRRKRASVHAVEGRASASPGACDNQLSCAELTESLEAGGEARASALVQLHGSVVRLAFEREGCRVVQLAIQVAEQATAEKLVQELHGHVHEAAESPHANYVLQTVVVSLPTALSAFVSRELLGAGADAARHRFGCRILCRLIEHAGASDLAGLLQEVLASAEELCRHPFARFVVQSILEHLPEHRPQISQALRADLLSKACHRYASRVVEMALEHCAEKDRRGLALELTGCLENVVTLAQSHFGHFVLRAALVLPGRADGAAWGRLRRAMPFVEGTKYGRRLLQDLGVTAEAAV